MKGDEARQVAAIVATILKALPPAQHQAFLENLFAGSRTRDALIPVNAGFLFVATSCPVLGMFGAVNGVVLSMIGGVATSYLTYRNYHQEVTQQFLKRTFDPSVPNSSLLDRLRTALLAVLPPTVRDSANRCIDDLEWTLVCKNRFYRLQFTIGLIRLLAQSYVTFVASFVRPLKHND